MSFARRKLEAIQDNRARRDPAGRQVGPRPHPRAVHPVRPLPVRRPVPRDTGSEG